MNSKDDQAGSHCSFRDRDEPLTRQPLSADEISVLECMALMEEEDRASFITRCSVSKRATDTDKLDRRHFNDPHRTVRAIGAEAARKGLRVFDCPYSHPAMRASWLKGFAQEQQQQLDF